MTDKPAFGLMGYPIEHSLSPVLFRQAYSGKWDYDLIEEAEFGRAWERFIGHYQAVNVTAPYKCDAFRKADFHSEECRRIGACNILVKTDKGIEAHNSDCLAVKSLLAEQEIEDGTVLIIGNGGAGKAAAEAARSLGMDTVVCNRTADSTAGIRPLAEISLLASVCDIVIYTLPCPIPEMDGVRCSILMEANYRTPSYVDGQAADKYIPGKEWLRRQAILGYGLMTGEAPDAEAMDI